MTTRWVWLLACAGWLGCGFYEPELLDPAPRAGTGGRAGQAATSGSGGETQQCIRASEVCNNRDDDCNGVVDDAEPADADCSQRLHATVSCGGGICLFIPMSSVCDPGYYHCDGQPNNGCESMTCCGATCDADGGADDAGVDDAG